MTEITINARNVLLLGVELCIYKGEGIVLYCVVVGSRRLMPPDALDPKAYCTNLGL